MATHSESPAKKSAVKSHVAARPPAMLFELDTVAAPGRKIAWDVLKKLMAERDATVTPALFARYCLVLSPAQYLPGLLDVLDKKRLSAAKLAAEITESMAAAFDQASVKANPLLVSVLERAKERGARLGAATTLARPVAERLSEKLGLAAMGVRLFVQESGERSCPTADTWLKLAKEVGVEPVRCAAIGTSAASCKASLSAGMRCIAIPDEFTSFQDYGGVNLVVEAVGKDTVSRIISVMEPAE